MLWLLWYWLGKHFALCRILWANEMCRAESGDLGFLPDNSQYQRNSQKLVHTTVCCDTMMTQVTHLSLKLVFSKHSALCRIQKDQLDVTGIDVYSR